MPLTRLISAYAVKRAPEKVIIEGYAEYTSPPIHMTGLAFTPTYIVIHNKVKQVQLIHRYSAPPPTEFDQHLFSHLTNLYGQPICEKLPDQERIHPIRWFESEKMIELYLSDYRKKPLFKGADHGGIRLVYAPLQAG